LQEEYFKKTTENEENRNTSKIGRERDLKAKASTG
jgi:hypothetical protein